MVGEIVDQRLYDEYQTRMARVEASAGKIAEGNAEHWWSLWEIYRDKSWRVEYKTFTEWLGMYCVQPYGDSRQSFYTRIKNIKRWQSLGLEDQKIIFLLGSRNETAIQNDIDEWFDSNGELKESVALRIEAGNETPSEFLERASKLSPGEARQEVQRVFNPEKIYPLDDSVVYDEKTGILMFNIRYDTEEDGCIWLGTVRITGVQIAPESNGLMFLPQRVAQWLCKRLSLRL